VSDDAQRRLILHISVSLDGFAARSDGVIDWLAPREQPDARSADRRVPAHGAARSRSATGWLMHGLPEPQRFELVSATTYADGCVSKVLQPA